MDRRQFLLATAGAGLAPWPAASAPAAAVPSSEPMPDPRFTPLRGFAGQDVACDALAIEGRIPSGLRGTLYRNGPGLFERGGQRYRHLFDGDGLVHAFRFTDRGVSHRARFVRTSKFVAESRAGRFLVPAFGTPIKAEIPVRGPDSINVANTSVLLNGGKLYALWEGGSAHALEPETLETLGPVDWSDGLKRMPFSAHPKVEPDGTVWNFGSMAGKLVLYQIAADGRLLRSHVAEIGASHFLHDFAVTERHLLFLLPPVELDPQWLRSGRSFAESLVWRGERPTRVLTIEKADFSARREFELPAFNFFHFGNAWEEANGVIHADFVRTDDLRLMNDYMPAMMRGETPMLPPSRPAILVVDPRAGQARVEVRGENCEFPRIDPRRVGRRHRYVFYTARFGADTAFANFDSVMRVDYVSGAVERFTFAPGRMLEEHVLVPRAADAPEADGWLVGVGFDARRQQSFVTVVDALRLVEGPVATAWLPYWLPPCFHGDFKSA